MEMTEQSIRLRILLTIVLVGVSLDQLAKEFAMAYLMGNPESSYLGDTVRIYYTENAGAFLSLGAGLSPNLRFWLFIVGTSCIVVGAAAYVLLAKTAKRIEIIAVSLVVAGGVGNLVDRVVLNGLVRDFLNIGIGPVRTGVFNVADMLITTAVILLLFDAVRRYRSSA